MVIYAGHGTHPVVSHCAQLQFLGGLGCPEIRMGSINHFRCADIVTPHLVCPLPTTFLRGIAGRHRGACAAFVLTGTVFGFPLGQPSCRASAVPPVRRVVRLPEGVFFGQYDAVQRGMFRADVAVAGSNVFQIRVRAAGAFYFHPAAALCAGSDNSLPFRFQIGAVIFCVYLSGSTAEVRPRGLLAVFID